MTSALLSPPLLLALLVTAASALTNFCAIGTCAKPHVLCNTGTGPNTTVCVDPIVVRGLTSDQEKQILDAHNRIRRNVNDGSYVQNGLPGGNLPLMTWSARLKRVARGWVHQCPTALDGWCDDLPKGPVGANTATIWMRPSQDRNPVADTVDRWASKKVGSFRNTNLIFSSDPSTNSLTQVIWKNTTKLGCSSLVFKKRVPVIGGRVVDYHKRFYVCNYFPKGNIRGERIY